MIDGGGRIAESHKGMNGARGGVKGECGDEAMTA